MSSKPAHGEVYSIQHYLIQSVSDLRQGTPINRFPITAYVFMNGYGSLVEGICKWVYLSNANNTTIITRLELFLHPAYPKMIFFIILIFAFVGIRNRISNFDNNRDFGRCIYNEPITSYVSE